MVVNQITMSSTYDITKRPSGNVWLTHIPSGKVTTMQPTLSPYAVGSSINFGDGNQVKFNEIVSLNGSTSGMPQNSNDLIKKLSDDFFFKVSGGGSTDASITPEERTFLQGLMSNANNED